jgi:hypothetical protein
MPKHREIWVLPYNYSCGGFYMAERFPAGIEVHLKGNVYNDNLSFWLLSGREVLNNTQVNTRLQHCEERGEVLTVVRAEALPENARWLNIR